MRALRFIGPGDGADHVIVETADGAERFALTVDAALRDAVRMDAPAPRPSAPGAASIGPREIQVRVRSGVSAQELAATHDMTIESVLRFAGPVIAERIRIADEARRAKARRSTTEGQTVVFGEAVDGRFTAHGIDPSTVSWDAYRRDDGQWIVTAGWLGGGTDRVAEWLFHLSARNVTPLDDTAADLLSDRPIRATARVEESVRPSLAAAPPLAPGVVAFPPMSGAAELDEVFDQDAEQGPVDNPRHTAAARSAVGLADPGADYDAALLPLHLAEAAGDAPADVAPASAGAAAAHRTRVPKVTNLGIASRQGESEERKPARPSVPAWDDILLGVRRKSD